LVIDDKQNQKNKYNWSSIAYKNKNQINLVVDIAKKTTNTTGHRWQTKKLINKTGHWQAIDNEYKHAVCLKYVCESAIACNRLRVSRAIITQELLYLCRTPYTDQS